jgi:hypothetical protein
VVGGVGWRVYALATVGRWCEWAVRAWVWWWCERKTGPLIERSDFSDSDSEAIIALVTGGDWVVIASARLPDSLGNRHCRARRHLCQPPRVHHTCVRAPSLRRPSPLLGRTESPPGPWVAPCSVALDRSRLSADQSHQPVEDVPSSRAAGTMRSHMSSAPQCTATGLVPGAREGC